MRHAKHQQNATVLASAAESGMILAHALALKCFLVVRLRSSCRCSCRCPVWPIYMLRVEGVGLDRGRSRPPGIRGGLRRGTLGLLGALQEQGGGRGVLRQDGSVRPPDVRPRQRNGEFERHTGYRISFFLCRAIFACNSEWFLSRPFLAPEVHRVGVTLRTCGTSLVAPPSLAFVFDVLWPYLVCLDPPLPPIPCTAHQLIRDQVLDLTRVRTSLRGFVGGFTHGRWIVGSRQGPEFRGNSERVESVHRAWRQRIQSNALAPSEHNGSRTVLSMSG